MYQHQHAPLPLKQLESVPQSVVSLIEVILDKDPKQHFQTPTELLRALPTMTGAIDEGPKSLIRNWADARWRFLFHNSQAPASLGPEKISMARLPVTKAISMIESQILLS
jgi:hypothetical protein